ncbi:MAG: hypothetical protein CMO80_22140 [Verrucomicrobiales bacterium]|nr:hypothetical protein [Verrucomicrobiales bacterium]
MLNKRFPHFRAMYIGLYNWVNAKSSFKNIAFMLATCEPRVAQRVNNCTPFVYVVNKGYTRTFRTLSAIKVLNSF